MLRRLHRAALALTLATLALVACALDEAELARPGTGVITADVGQLRVLGYDVDPTVDQWIDVVTPDPEVVVETETFRETGAALLAEGDTPGDRRRLFEATGPGRTLLVELNCGPVRCDGTDDPAEVGVQVWEFAVGVGGDLSSDSPLAGTDELLERRVGEFVVIARDGGGLLEIESDDEDRPGVRHVATSSPGGSTSTQVDVFLAVAAGAVEVRDDATGDVYAIEVIRAG